MVSVSKLLASVLTGLIIISGCNTSEEGSSPYEGILVQQPFAPLTDSIKKNGSDPDLYYRRGLVLKKNNLPEPALADFQKAWSLRKKEEYAVNLSNVLIAQKPDSAVRFLIGALQVFPSSIFLQLNLAQVYEDQHKTDEALKICEAILQKQPGQLDALVMKSDLLEKRNNGPEATASLEKAFRLAPSDVDLCYDLAFKYAQDRNIKVIALCDSLIRLDKVARHAEPFYFKGVYYANTGNKEKALELFNLAIKSDYNFLDAHLDKGKLLYDQQQYGDALKTFRLANTISITNADGYFWMAKCQEALNQKQEALLNYQRAYGLDKSFTEAKTAADRIGTKPNGR